MIYIISVVIQSYIEAGIYFFKILLTLESQCCYDLVAAWSSAISKRREAFPSFQSAFVDSFYNIVFDFVTTN